LSQRIGAQNDDTGMVTERKGLPGSHSWRWIGGWFGSREVKRATCLRRRLVAADACIPPTSIAFRQIRRKGDLKSSFPVILSLVPSPSPVMIVQTVGDQLSTLVWIGPDPATVDLQGNDGGSFLILP
jgi:hypothetical protein